MNRTANTAVNFVVGFVVAYLVASRVGDRDSALKPALLSGVVTAAIAWVGYEKPEFLAGEDDGGDASEGSDADGAAAA